MWKKPEYRAACGDDKWGAEVWGCNPHEAFSVKKSPAVCGGVLHYIYATVRYLIIGIAICGSLARVSWTGTCRCFPLRHQAEDRVHSECSKNDNDRESDSIQPGQQCRDKVRLLYFPRFRRSIFPLDQWPGPAWWMMYMIQPCQQSSSVSRGKWSEWTVLVNSSVMPWKC